MFYSRRSALPSRAGSIVAACAAMALAGSLFASPASAANPTVTGRVVDDERPLSDASVTLKGPHVDRKTVTNGAGTFTFPDVPAGRYHLAAVKGNRGGEQDIDVSATGVTNVMIEADPLSNTASETPREIGHVATRSRSSSGTSVSLTGRDLAHNPAGDDLSKLLLQMPATVRGANGRVDVNGQRNGIGYVIDGVPVPAVGLSTQIDPDDLSGFTVTEGAYSARIGDPYGAVVQAETIPPSGAPQLSGNVKADTLGTALSELGYHLPLPRGGAVALNTQLARTDHGFDPPQPYAIHDSASLATQSLRVRSSVAAHDILDLNLTHSLQTSQIPYFSNAPQDDSERQNTTVATLRYRHRLGDHGVFSFGPTITHTRTRDFADAQALTCVTSPPISEASAVCSAAADRNVDEAGFAADYANRSARHDVAFGGFVRTTNVGARYATILTGSQTPIAGDPLRTGHRQAAYAQDQWQLGKLTFEPGLRLDTEQISGTDASGGFAQLSPASK